MEYFHYTKRSNEQKVYTRIQEDGYWNHDRRKAQLRGNQATIWYCGRRSGAQLVTHLSDGRPRGACHRTPRRWQYGQGEGIAKGCGRRSTSRSVAAAGWEQLSKKLAGLGFGRRATPTQKTQVVQMLRQKHSLNILLLIAQLPRATFYYHLKRMGPDKYEDSKAEIVAIYHENKGRYGYRRITTELHNRDSCLNHKTVQKLMKELGLIYRIRMKKYRSYKGEVGKIAPNLLNRDFYAERPNQK